MTTELAARPFGGLLREWRVRRRMSQLELANDAEISTKHLSFLETGRARPSRQMLLRLAACLDVPLRGRNGLLQSVGFPPIFEERVFTAPALGVVRRNVEAMLSAYDPDPAVAVDRHWAVVAANRAATHLVDGTEPALLRQPANMLRLLLHPAGMAPRIVNLGQWRAHIIARLRRQIESNGDPVLMDLLEEIRAYPGVRTFGSSAAEEERDSIAIPLRIATMDGVLSFHQMTTVFTASIDITLSELSIETFLPANAQTASAMRQARRPDATQARLGGVMA